MKSLMCLLALILWSFICPAGGQADVSPRLDETLWTPKSDVLHLILKQARWRMSVEEFRKEFKGSTLAEKDWVLSRGSFRKEIAVDYPNTRAVFEFSGVVDEAWSSSLVSFQIIHPVKSHPNSCFQSPPENIHYQYLKRLHDAHKARLNAASIKYQHEEDSGGKYICWEQFDSEADGELTFTYWSNTSGEGIFARAPAALIAEDLEKERRAAAIRTRNWPLPACGNR